MAKTRYSRSSSPKPLSPPDAQVPADAPLERALRAFEALGFQQVRVGNHIALLRINADGTRAPMTLPNHRLLKGATLRTVLTQTGISRDDFLAAYEKA